MKIAVAFIDFKKAFDSVSHTILERKLECDFGLSGSLLSWVSSYLRGRRQYTAVNDFMIDGDLMTIIERKLKYNTMNKLITK